MTGTHGKIDALQFKILAPLRQIAEIRDVHLAAGHHIKLTLRETADQLDLGFFALGQLR